MKLLLTLSSLLLINSCVGYSQNIIGLWNSTYKIQNWFSEDGKKYNAVIRAINKGETLLDFIDDSTVYLKKIEGPLRKGTYTREKNLIVINIKDHIIRGIIEENSIHIRDSVSPILIDSIFYKKIIPKEIKNVEKYDEEYFTNTSWKIITDTSSKYHNTTIHLLDSNQFVINYDNNKRRLVIYFNDKWNVTSYKGHLFLKYNSLILQDDLFLNIFHFHNYQKNHFRGTTFEQNNYHKQPQLNESLSIKKIKNISNHKKKKIEQKLIGKWSTKNIHIPYAFDDKENNIIVKDCLFEISINEDHTIEHVCKGTVIKEGTEQIIQKDNYGTWSVGPTGDYIQYINSRSYPEYVYIDNIDDNLLEINFNFLSFNGWEINSKSVVLERVIEE